MKTKTWFMALLAMAIVVGFGSRKVRAATFVDASITVTPTATVNLSLPVTTYAYGPIPVSSQAVSASSITVYNVGDVNVGLDSKIQTDAALWVSSDTVGVNQYSLFVATSTVQPQASDFTAIHRFNAFPGVAKPLAGIGGGDPTLTLSGPTNQVNLWFRLDTPTSVSSLAGQTITLRFTGTGR